MTNCAPVGAPHSGALVPGSPLVDSHGRSVSYLRLSVTDRCNLRCRYCFSKDNLHFIPHGGILSYEELLDIAALARELGINKIRLTGGEPFVRRDFLGFIERLVTANPGVDLRLTTNATLLPGKIRELRDLGVTRLNISLDTLNREKFREITGRDFLPQVRAAIDEVLEFGLSLKINAVAMRGVNDDELGDFMRFAAQHPLEMRFIEFMPMGDDDLWSQSLHWPADDILAQAKEMAELDELPRRGSESGPARVWAIRGGLGRLGLITPLTSHFCGSCNRLRITPDGRLRTCLFSDREYSLRPLLRNPRLGISAARKVIVRALAQKPIGAELLAARKAASSVAHKRMSAIGG